MQTKLKSKKHYIINAVIILIVTLLTLFYMLKSGMLKQIGYLSKIPWNGILAIILIIFIAMLFQCFVYFNSAKETGTNLNFAESATSYFMGFLGSGITPLKTGHFPFIFYYYAKKKVSFENSLSIVCLNQIVFSITTIISYLVLMILCLANHTVVTISGTTINLWLAALAGLLFNLGALLLVILMAYVKPFHRFIVKTCSFFMLKFKKIESREEYEAEHTKKMEIYRKQIDYTFKHLYKFILPILSFFLYLAFFCSVPYIIYMFFTGSTFSLADYVFFFSMNQAMTYITNVIPVPGGTGVAEFSFLAIFGTAFSESMIGSAMIVWRLLTYYIPVIATFILFLIVMAASKPKQQVIPTTDEYTKIQENSEISTTIN